MGCFLRRAKPDVPRCDRREQIAIPLCSTKSKACRLWRAFLIQNVNQMPVSNPCATPRMAMCAG